MVIGLPVVCLSVSLYLCVLDSVVYQIFYASRLVSCISVHAILPRNGTRSRQTPTQINSLLCLSLSRIYTSTASMSDSTARPDKTSRDPCTLFSMVQYECSPANGKITCWPLERIFRQYVSSSTLSPVSPVFPVPSPHCPVYRVSWDLPRVMMAGVLNKGGV